MRSPATLVAALLLVRSTRPAASAAPTDQVVFLLGVEGVGHHGVTQVLKQLSYYQTPARAVWWGKLQKSMTMWSNRTTVKLDLLKYMDAAQTQTQNKTSIFLEDRSFPSGSLGWQVEAKLAREGPEFIKRAQKRY